MSDHPRVAIDAHRIVREPHSSGATYLDALLRGTRELGLSRRVVLLLPEDPAHPDPLLAHFERISPKKRSSPEASLRAQLYWNQVVLPRLVRRAAPDVFFSPFHLTPLATTKPIVTTIHDLCFMRAQRGRGRLVHQAFVDSALLRARRIITVSRFTQGQLTDYRPRAARSATTVYNAVVGATLDRVEARLLVNQMVPAVRDSSFVLWIGSFSDRKNPELVLDIAAHLDVPVIALVPRHHLSRAQDRFGRELTLSGVGGSEKDALLRAASLLLFPSACEGFGYPAAEAMRQGCPVVSIEGGAVAELVGDLVPPGRPTSQALAELSRYLLGLSEAERRVLEDRLIQRSFELFSETEMARGTWAVLSSAALARAD